MVYKTKKKINRTALVGVSGRPVLCVELEAEAEARPGATLTAELLGLGARHPHTAGVRDVLYHPGFPVDIRHNAKIGREQLAGWAAKRLS